MEMILLLLAWLALSVSGDLYCLGGGYSHNKEISFSYTCLNETSTVKVACQFTNSSGFKALRMNGIDQHCHSLVQPGLGGTEVSCSFLVSTVLTGSTFECYSDVSGSMSFNITLFSDECVPPVNSRIAVSNSTVTFQCNDGFIFLESSRALCELQLHTNIETNRTHSTFDWVPMITSGCVANISNDTTEPNTPGNLDLLWLLILCLVVAIIVAIIVTIKCKKKAEQSNTRGEPPTDSQSGVTTSARQPLGGEEIQTDSSLLDSYEVEEETDDEKLDIESCFPVVSQEVADHGDTDIITPPAVKTYEDGPRSRKSREFQLKHDGSMVKDLQISTKLQPHSSPLAKDSDELKSDEVQDDLLLLLTPLSCYWEILSNSLKLKKELNLKGNKEANLKHLVEYHFSQHPKNKKTAVAKLVIALEDISKSTDYDVQTRQLLEATAKNISSKYNPGYLYADVSSSPPSKPDVGIEMEGYSARSVVGVGGEDHELGKVELESY